MDPDVLAIERAQMTVGTSAPPGSVVGRDADGRLIDDRQEPVEPFVPADAPTQRIDDPRLSQVSGSP